jgi:hypothetical protein
MFWTQQKNNQHFSKTWQQALKRREIEKNNYHATGDIKKAKAFVAMVSNFTFPIKNEQETEHVIFSSEALAVPLVPAYTFI